MSRHPLSSILLALVLTAAPAAAVPPICDGSTALTLIGMDTASGRTLFSVPPIGDRRPGWIVELDGDGREARAWPDDTKGRFGGSVGPGPVLAAAPAVPCLQPVRWNEGIWEPLGEPTAAPVASTVTPPTITPGRPGSCSTGRPPGRPAQRPGPSGWRTGNGRAEAR